MSESPSSWFELPDADDDGIDVSMFVVSITGPDTYDPDPRLGDTPRPSPYRGGSFRVEITTPHSYPARGGDKGPPEIRFSTSIFHPLIDTSSASKGKICVDIVKELWMDAWEGPGGEPLVVESGGVGPVHPHAEAPSGEGHLWTTLLMLRKFLTMPQWEYSRGVNAEAKGLIKEEDGRRRLNMDDFDAKARELVQKNLDSE